MPVRKPCTLIGATHIRAIVICNPPLQLVMGTNRGKKNEALDYAFM